jgi:hypothetical protein
VSVTLVGLVTCEPSVGLAIETVGFPRLLFRGYSLRPSHVVFAF